MKIKNVISGEVHTDGGEVKIGDTIIHYHIDGLQKLLSSYKAHLITIEKLLDGFKLKSALDSLKKLEESISESQIKNGEISSKILYLKASCKRELNPLFTKETAKDFIRAYKINPSDEKLKEKACIEYLNIDEKEKSLKLAEEIYEKDEFNITYWYVQIFCAEDMESTISEIPKVVFNDFRFQHTLIYHIVRNEKSNYENELNKYGLEITIEVEKYSKLNFENKSSWIIAIDLLINTIFNKSPIKYVSGESFIIEDNPLVDDAVSLINNFLDLLKDSEIQESINHHKFYFYYFKYTQTKEKKVLNEIESVYSKMSDKSWSYTMALCQLLNNAKFYDKSLQILEDFEKTNDKVTSELYVFKVAIMYILNKNEKISIVFEDYLKSIDILDEIKVFNILNAFLDGIYRTNSGGKTSQFIEKTLEKDFIDNETKTLFQIISYIRYFNDYDKDDLYQKLFFLKEKNKFKNQCKILIVQALDILGSTKEAVNYFSSFLDKTKISENLKFYIHLLYKELHLNKETGIGIYKELLALLKFFRLNSNKIDIDLLSIEHNLNLEKNDWKELKEIDFKLYQHSPNDEQILYSYLLCLEKLNMQKELEELSKEIKDQFENETNGINIAKLLVRNNLIKKGSLILYNLAKEPSNIEARKTYFGFGINIGDHIYKKFDEVKKGVWVKYSINDDRIEEVKVTGKSEFQKSLIGKKLNEKVSTINNLTEEINKIEILEIYNDELKLNYDIQKEIQNPMNELGFTSLNIPKEIEDFEEFLKKNFGFRGEEEKKFTEGKLKEYYSYKIGFTEVVRLVFKDNPINAYYILTEFKEHTFTCIPNLLTQDVNEKQEIDYVLDFTSLLLFYNLEQDLDFNFKKKFKISFYLKELISMYLIEETNTPESPMTVHISSTNVRKYITPEGMKERRIKLFKSLIEWIDKNCEIDLVEEKLDISFNMANNNNLSDISTKYMIDYMLLSNRDNARLISNDSTIYLFQSSSGLYNNILNPEKYVLRFHSEKINTDFYRYLLKSNYLGISINFDTLKNEFFDHIVGKKNYYNQCLKNLQYSIHNDGNFIYLVSKFLKELYLMNSILLETKNRYAFEILRNFFYGMPKNIIISFENTLRKDFRLLGNSSDQIINTFKEVRNIYFP
jgi:hypothetical protein